MTEVVISTIAHRRTWSWTDKHGNKYLGRKSSWPTKTHVVVLGTATDLVGLGGAIPLTKEIVLTRDELKDMVLTDRYLFHMTSPDALRAILESESIKPLTYSGSPKREFMHSSFTENPVKLMDNIEHAVGVGDKRVVMIFDREKLLGTTDLRKVEYYTRKSQLYKPELWWTDVEDFEGEHEWRSPSEVPIRGNFVGWATYDPIDARTHHLRKRKS